MNTDFKKKNIFSTKALRPALVVGLLERIRAFEF